MRCCLCGSQTAAKTFPPQFELTPPWNHLTLPGGNSPRRAANSSTNTVRSRASVLHFTALRPAHNDYFRPPPVSCAAPLKDLQGKAGLKAEQFAAALVVFTVFLIYNIFGGSLIVNVVGFVYPATQSVQVLSSGGDNEADLKQWLTYWIVFALFNVLEMATRELASRSTKVACIPKYASTLLSSVRCAGQVQRQSPAPGLRAM